MANNDPSYDRHQELWKEHDKRIGRWVIATLLFAVVLVHRVLIPFTEIPRQKAALERELHQVQLDLQATQPQRESLRKSENRLAEVKSLIKQGPWTAERDNLRRSLFDLQSCAGVVLAIPRKMLIARVNAAADLDLDRAALLLSLLAPAPLMDVGMPLVGGYPPDVRQFPGASHEHNPFPILPGLSVAQHDPRLNSLTLGDLPVSNLPVVPPLPIDSGNSTIDQSLARDLRAILVLGLDRDLMTGDETEAQLFALLESQKQKQGQRLADETVMRVTETVERLVIQPLEDLPGDLPEVAQLRTEVERWERQHLGEPQWYATVPGKGETINMPGVQATLQTDALKRALEGKEHGLEERMARLGNAELASKQELAMLDNQREKLESRMQKLLPEWLQDVVTADQMLQIYPLTLLGLLASISLQAFLIRTHYVVVRSGHGSPVPSVEDPAMSSLWTLVYRGPVFTLLTAGIYLGFLVVVGLYFEWGCRLLSQWLVSQPDEAWVLNRFGSYVIRMFGHLFFLVSGVAVVRILLRERAVLLRTNHLAPPTYKAKAA